MNLNRSALHRRVRKIRVEVNYWNKTKYIKNYILEKINKPKYKLLKNN
jgi:hypothetical protein